MKSLVQFGMAFLLAVVLQSCKKEVASSTEMKVETQQYTDTNAIDTIETIENVETSESSNRSTSNGAAAASNNNKTTSSSSNTSSEGTTGQESKDETVKNNAVDENYNGRGTVSGSKSGVHTGSGSNASQGSSTASGNSKK